MKHLSRERRCGDRQDTEVWESIWPAISKATYPADQYATLALYARDEVSQIKGAIEPFAPQAETAGKMADIMAFLRGSMDMPLEEVIGSLSSKTTELTEPHKKRQKAIKALRLAASLCAMVRIRMIESPSALTEEAMEPAVHWRPEKSLKYVTSEFFRTAASNDSIDCLIDHKLTMSYLAVYHKYEVIWVDSLDQHLQVDRKFKTVKIFQHKIWLSAYLGATNECLVPEEVISEALDTLNLLFPHNDRRTQAFLKERNQRFYSLGHCGRDQKLNLVNYPRWGSNIEELLDIMRGPRSGLWHFMPRPDRLNLVESANFWIAAFVAVLAIISFVFGLIAVVYAKESLKVSKESLELTKLQYLLSVAQAYSTPESARLLPDFCPKSR